MPRYSEPIQHEAFLGLSRLTSLGVGGGKGVFWGWKASGQAGEGFSVPSIRLGPKLQVDVDRVLIGLTAWRLDLQARPAFVRE